MLKTGDLVAGRYRLGRKVGEGASATVWSATHEVIGRPVAIKFVYLQGPRAEVKAARFLREARIAAAVRHRFVVDIFDFGSTEDGQPFMVMEYLDGETLASRLASLPPMLVSELLQICCDCLLGLEAVHAAGIIHRDLKPENIFLVADGERWVPKLLDFGISREDALADADPVAGRLTRQGTVLGTPDYMAPEQTRSRGKVDRRADIYAMGVILYEALAGDLPFKAEGVGELLMKVVHDNPSDLALLRADLPPALSSLVKTAMAKKPAARFASAAAMREALLAVIDATNGLRARRLWRPTRAITPGPMARAQAEEVNQLPTLLDHAAEQTRPPGLDPGPSVAPATRRRGSSRWWLVASLGALGLIATAGALMWHSGATAAGSGGRPATNGTTAPTRPEFKPTAERVPSEESSEPDAGSAPAEPPARRMEPPSSVDFPARRRIRQRKPPPASETPPPVTPAPVAPGETVPDFVDTPGF